MEQRISSSLKGVSMNCKDEWYHATSLPSLLLLIPQVIAPRMEDLHGRLDMSRMPNSVSSVLKETGNKESANRYNPTTKM